MRTTVKSELLEPRRLLSAGDIDASFGVNGFIEGLAGLDVTLADSKALDNGKILIAGTEGYFSQRNIILARLNSNGSLDASFGGNGKGYVRVDADAEGPVHALQVRADGKILVGGDGFIARFNSNGTPDSSFSGDGLIQQSGTVMAILPDNRILAGDGRKLVRLTSGGSLDNTFTAFDASTLEGFSSIPDFSISLVVQTDGKPILTGRGSLPNSGFTELPVFVRLNKNGGFDSSFADDGIAVASVPAASMYTIVARNTALTKDGKILSIASDDDGLHHLLRLNADGTQDQSFGINGTVYLGLNPDRDQARLSDLQLLPDGRIVVASIFMFDDVAGAGFTVRRLMPDGSADTTFSYDSTAIHSIADLPHNAGFFNARSLHLLVTNGGYDVLTTAQDDWEASDYFPIGLRLQASPATPSFATLNSSGTLSIVGDPGINTIKVTESAGKVNVLSASLTLSFDAAKVKKINIDTGAGDDLIEVFAARPTTVLGGKGDDTIRSSSTSNTYLVGGSGADEINGGPGNDLIEGNSGDDDLTAQGGEDIVNGGTGNDRLHGNDGTHVLYGQDGNDFLFGGTGHTLDGGSGNDLYLSYAGGATITFSGRSSIKPSFDDLAINLGNGEVDRFEYHSAVTIVGTAGKDRFSGNVRMPLYIDGAGGDDWFKVWAYEDVNTGESAAVTLNGSGGNDYFITTEDLSPVAILGGSGDDYLEDHASLASTYIQGTPVDLGSGFDTDDCRGANNIGLGSLRCGPGVEKLIGNGQTANHLYGNDLNNILIGTDFNDIIEGGGGHDLLIGAGDNDLLIGGSGNDTLDGQLGADTFVGNSGNDTADYSSRTTGLRISLDNIANDGVKDDDADRAGIGYGGTYPGPAGDDVRADIETILGGSGNDTIIGNPFANKLIGNAGNDTIWGGDGNDTLIGGPGNDSLFGQEGNNTITQ